MSEETLGKTSRREALTSLLIALYLSCQIAWLSLDSPLRTRIVEPFTQFWLFWGLDQNWRLFSPEIKNINFHTVAVITFEDGSKLNWELPRMKRLNYWERFRDEKYRKWCVDSLPWPDYKEFWPDFARYAGRKYYQPNNKPVSLSLLLYWIEIPKPEAKIVPVAKLPEHTKVNTVFYYRYKASDFAPEVIAKP
ncbi:MAG: hypothetical protein IPP57_01825 [Candidatus Obscuribacter sp.]|jgi:hypothetical protein|nr:hypothetical protein [Candidatus Obscuribacter sp.]MDQ5968169.1 hypothetical protein [Cyanobacteriota bacterium erpe_2018_sw_39hr_WHONDRS-SW48-000098_B_bin.30]MBK7839482.1 hypothetical protein [Candidatus Obscuribacter sp.]MBK9202179.1 hypothetical protein [Candidatus Obscuribacter sp.]MBK9619034.1 hypothetical protein [Candidatus Obscuribacter sp.]